RRRRLLTAERVDVSCWLDVRRVYRNGFAPADRLLQLQRRCPATAEDQPDAVRGLRRQHHVGRGWTQLRLRRDEPGDSAFRIATAVPVSHVSDLPWCACTETEGSLSHAVNARGECTLSRRGGWRRPRPVLPDEHCRDRQISHVHRHAGV